MAANSAANEELEEKLRVSKILRFLRPLNVFERSFASAVCCRINYGAQFLLSSIVNVQKILEFAARGLFTFLIFVWD